MPTTENVTPIAVDARDFTILVGRIQAVPGPAEPELTEYLPKEGRPGSAEVFLGTQEAETISRGRACTRFGAGDHLGGKLADQIARMWAGFAERRGRFAYALVQAALEGNTG